MENTNLQSDLNKLEKWSNAMQMRYHPAKCKVMHMGKKNPETEYEMTMADGIKHTLESVEEEKDLGVTVDKGLKFKHHIQNCVNKANQMLGVVKRTFTNINKEVMIPLFKGMIRPHLEYASCVWSPSMKYLKTSIENVQRRATKLIPELKTKSYEERLRILKLPSLCYRRRRSDILQMYKIIHNIDHMKEGLSCRICGENQMFEATKSKTTRGHSYKIDADTASYWSTSELLHNASYTGMEQSTRGSRKCTISQPPQESTAEKFNRESPNIQGFLIHACANKQQLTVRLASYYPYRVQTVISELSVNYASKSWRFAYYLSLSL
jgi:hypothetical protein